MTEGELYQVVKELAAQMIKESIPLDPKLAEILEEKFWDYYENYRSRFTLNRRFWCS